MLKSAAVPLKRLAQCDRAGGDIRVATDVMCCAFVLVCIRRTRSPTAKVSRDLVVLSGLRLQAAAQTVATSLPYELASDLD